MQTIPYILTCHMILRTTRSTFTAGSMRVDKSDVLTRHFWDFFFSRGVVWAVEEMKEKKKEERKNWFI